MTKKKQITAEQREKNRLYRQVWSKKNKDKVKIAASKYHTKKNPNAKKRSGKLSVLPDGSKNPEYCRNYYKQNKAMIQAKRKAKVAAEKALKPPKIPKVPIAKIAKSLLEKKPKQVNYLSNKSLAESFVVSKELGRMSDCLATKLMLLVDRYGKSPQFNRYTFNEDMRAYALMSLVKSWSSFNPEKSSNYFSFYTQCIKNSFIQMLNQEKTQRNIRDQELMFEGQNTSFKFQEEYASEMKDRLGVHHELESDRVLITQEGYDHESD